MSSSVSQFWWRLGGQPQSPDQGERRLPKPVVRGNPNPGAGPGEPRHLLQDRLNIPHVVQQIGQEDDVEGPLHRKAMAVGLHQPQVGVAGGRQGQHPRREVHAHAHRRL
jgi:hypothetical protein